MDRMSKRILLYLSGQAGVIGLSALILLVVMYLAGYTGGVVYEMVALLTLIRIAYYLTRGPAPVLTAIFVRKRLKKVLNEESRVAIAFVAACYVLQWPVGRRAIILFLAVNFAIQMATLFVARTGRRTLARRAREGWKVGFAKQVVIVGTGAKGREVADMILRSPELDTLLAGFLDYHRRDLWRYRDIPLLGHPDILPKLVSNRQVDALIVAVDPEDMAGTRTLFETAEKMGVTVCLLPNVYNAQIAKARPGYINGTPVVVYRAVPDGQTARAVKWMIDKVGALAGLILAMPLFLITAVAIKLESRGPVLFKQVRLGLNGRTFHLYKFRTMCDGAETQKDCLRARNEMSGPVFKIKDDPRVTPVGRLLRKYSIDELPQFLNVLRGEMSLVGPRPPLPKEVAQYEPWQHRKLSVKPGVTCLWQVNGRNNIDFDEWMRLDLQYIDNWSLWLDTKLLAKTIPAVIRSRGAS
jgi:exopolysaccharide biosynthesis polyprenyl glycosylphosphotransferase